MSGAVREVAKPITKVGQSLGIVKKPSTPAPAPARQAEALAAQPPAAQPPAAAAPSAPAARAAEEAATQAAVTRRARRRGGRTLLSEARLNPELGVGQSTLGVGPM